jgi:diguanylate cyclase (GGDEF)-like protein
MLKKIWNNFIFSDYKEYKNEIISGNTYGLNILLAVSLPISVLNYFLQTLIYKRISDSITLFLLIFLLIAILVKKFLITTGDNLLLVMYLLASVIFFYTIMLGTVLDTEHDALTYFLFLIIIPAFILDRPVRLISFSTAWTIIFLILSFIYKSHHIFMVDLQHGLEYYLCSITLSLFILSVRIGAVRTNMHLHYLIEHDPVSAVYNRSGMLNHMKKYVGSNLAIAIIKIEGLSFYSDIYGSEYGDDLLNGFANILKSYFNPSDLYELYRGDFVIVLPDGNEVDCYRKLNMVKAEFADFYKDKDLAIIPSFSTGYVYGKCRTVTDFRMMVRQADLHCSRASFNGAGSIEGSAYDHTDKYSNEVTDQIIRQMKAGMLDQLTGLMNMKTFFTRAAEFASASRTGKRKLVFLYFNIENMKEYNMRFGYERGDKFIKAIGNTIKENFPDRPVGRFGEDHFSVMCFADECDETVKSISRQIMAYHRLPSMSIKCGVSEWNSDITPSECCDRAKIASDSIKGNYDQVIAWYDDSLYEDRKLRNYLIDHLDEAINKEHIKIYYQSIIDAGSGKTIGYEALSRWMDPEMGMIRPDKFIPLMEDAHLISRLDDYVLDHVLNFIRILKNKGAQVLPVSINLSRYDFALGDPTVTIPAMVDEYELPHELINLEITERAFSDKSGLIMDAVDKLREEGFQVWVDDFGSEFSSLNMIQKFHFDLLKIDMKFVRDLGSNRNSEIILKSIIDLTKKINVKSLCEGVETIEQYNFLKESGCDYIQGYYFSRPISKEELMDRYEGGE